MPRGIDLALGARETCRPRPTSLAAPELEGDCLPRCGSFSFILLGAVSVGFLLG